MILNRLIRALIFVIVAIWISGCASDSYIQEPLHFKFFDLERAEDLRKQGFSYHTTGQYQQALDHYDQAILMDPHFAEAYGSRGTTYYMLDQYQLLLNRKVF